MIKDWDEGREMLRKEKHSQNGRGMIDGWMYLSLDKDL
jgi:hypothetical protein